MMFVLGSLKQYLSSRNVLPRNAPNASNDGVIARGITYRFYYASELMRDICVKDYKMRYGRKHPASVWLARDSIN